MKEFNLNHKIKVKLSQKGIDILNERYSQYGFYKQPDSEGYFEFQMWEFMNLYGRYMQFESCDVFLESLILIDENDLTAHKAHSLRRIKDKQK